MRPRGPAGAVRSIREAKGWTRAQMARAMGVAEKTVYNWESGRTRRLRRADIERLVRL